MNTATNMSRAIVSKKKLSQLRAQDGYSASAGIQKESSPAVVVSRTSETIRKEGETNVSEF